MIFKSVEDSILSTFSYNYYSVLVSKIFIRIETVITYSVNPLNNEL